MTKLPMETWEVKARPDLPSYGMNVVDARPGSELPATEIHHIWRRSFTAGPTAWVELADGTLVPNEVGLSQESHELIERGGHRIVAALARSGKPIFYWLTDSKLDLIERAGLSVYEAAAKYGHPLSPQPGPGPQVAADGRTPVGTDAVRGDVQLDIEGGETPHDEVCEHPHKAGQVPEGSTCPTCERRVPRKKKKDSPNTKTTSYRVPLDSVEDHKEMLEAVSEHMEIGTKKPHWQFWTITGMAAVVLQLPKDQVKVK